MGQQGPGCSAGCKSLCDLGKALVSLGQFLLLNKTKVWAGDRHSPTSAGILFHAQHCLGTDDREGTNQELTF